MLYDCVGRSVAENHTRERVEIDDVTIAVHLGAVDGVVDCGVWVARDLNVHRDIATIVGDIPDPRARIGRGSGTSQSAAQSAAQSQHSQQAWIGAWGVDAQHPMSKGRTDRNRWRRSTGVGHMHAWGWGTAHGGCGTAWNGHGSENAWGAGPPNHVEVAAPCGDPGRDGLLLDPLDERANRGRRES